MKSIAATEFSRNRTLAPRIIALSCAVPGPARSQSAIYDRMYRTDFSRVHRAEEIFCSVGVNTRHTFFYPDTVEAATLPTTQQRMQLWKEAALKLGRTVLGDVLAKVERERIGSFMMTSCTGYDTPSPGMMLAGEFTLPAHLRRSFIGHVGCHAAFTAIKSSLDALAARPDEAALVSCTEICSIHVRVSDTSREQIICQALFGDAGAALVLANAPEGHGPEVLHTHTETLHEHAEHLGWSIRDDGFRMSISPQVPSLIGGAVEGFVERLLAPLRMTVGDVRHWCIHPGGPRIIDKVGDALGLRDEQTRPSRDVLAEFGNCSSPTILLVLDRLLKRDRPQAGEYGVMLGFGPGLTLEGLVLRF